MNDWRPFVFGGLASVTAECGTFPVDTTKTRLQIQGQAIDANLKELKYRGMTHAFLRICKEEGVCALYSGLAPAVLRQATYGTIKIGIYHSLKRALFPEFKDERLLPNVCCGIIAGVVSSSLANPTDVLKIRMQAQTDGFGRRGIAASFSDIFRKEGVRGLWRGVGPTANRAMVVCGVELPAYDFCKKHFIYSGLMNDSTLTHFVSSFIAGLAGAIASNPIDVVKIFKGSEKEHQDWPVSKSSKFFIILTRMMNQRHLRLATGTAGAGVATPAIYTGSLDCIVQTYRHEGFFALYKGFIPNWLRLGPWNIIFFITFEKMKRMNDTLVENQG